MLSSPQPKRFHNGPNVDRRVVISVGRSPLAEVRLKQLKDGAREVWEVALTSRRT